MGLKNLNEQLMQAVSAFETETVKMCLEKGADPNYERQYTAVDDESIQPTTPLKLVMFRISDNFLEDKDLQEFKKIASILLEYGADPEPAMHIAKSRYGKYSAYLESNAFTDVWHIVAKAYKDTFNVE